MAGFTNSMKGAFGMMLNKPLSSYNRLETTDGKQTLIAKDGSLVTIFKIYGTQKMAGEQELNSLVRALDTRFSPNFENPGHAIQFWFSRDPDLAGPMLKKIMRSSKKIAKDLDMDIDDFFAEKEKHLKDYVIQEDVYMAVWTRPSILSKQELAKMKVSIKAPTLWPRQLDTQDFFRASRIMSYKHHGFVTGLIQDLKDVSIRSRILNSHDALKAIKTSLYPDMHDSDWRPYLPGDIYVDKNKKSSVPFPRGLPQGPKDLSPLLWPRLDNQLFDKGAEKINNQVIKMGKYLMGGIDMTMGPQNIVSFTHMLNRMVEDEFPWRVSFLMEGSSFSGMNFMAQIASITAFTNSENRYIADAVKAIKEYQNQGGVACRFRVSFATWAPDPKLELLEERLSRLQKAVESWGFCQASPSSGDPVSGVLSTALGIDAMSTAPAGAPPLFSALKMFPWMRDASPFETGSVLFRTIDGRPWPYQPGSNMQDTFIDIIYAPPGKGKSVLLNTQNLAFCLSPKATIGIGGVQLPRIAIIDIGPSSSGFISLIKESLPPKRRDEVGYFKLKNRKENAINPFDTQLGCRKPLVQEKTFLVNFISLLGTDPSRTAPPDGLSAMASAVIDLVYEQFSDRSQQGTPKPYVQGEDVQVENAIREENIFIPEHASWWDVVDELFEKGRIHEATLAQRYAVPLISDMMQIISMGQITDIYSGAKTETGESLIASFRRILSSSMNEYPLLSIPTQFSLGNARVISLDIGEATTRGSANANKQTALIYMLSRYIVARDFYLNEDNLSEMNKDYRTFHEPRIKRIRETPKRIVFDEFHRTEGSQMVRDQVAVDMREGRKWGVEIAISSQVLLDFDKSMISLATGFWILGATNEDDIKAASELFGLSRTAELSFNRYLHGPGRGGAPFLVILHLKDGKHEHLLYNTLGPLELWAFSTTQEDVAIRNILYQKIGPKEARRRLAKRFPDGSAKKEVERRLVEKSESTEMDKIQNDSVISEIAREIEEML